LRKEGHLYQEIEMNSKRILPAAIAATILGATAYMPVTQAQTADPANPTMEQRGEQAQGAIKDAWLDGKLESAYLFNEHLSPFDINTDVENGVVRLTGIVESDIDRDLAGEIAKSIDGVTDVKNDLAVDKTKARIARDDDASRERSGFKHAVGNATLTAKIKSQLLANENTSGMAVNVDSDDGAVTLSGSVDSDEEKELIARIAENTSGADSVDNRLTVETEAEEDAE
jgi:osmotically-inducible protein OsmY